MRKTSTFKRFLAALLSLVLVLGMLPVFGMAPVAFAEEGVETVDEGDGSENTTQSGPTGDYITMPITIRDFAADGMLFEYNETGNSGTRFVAEETVSTPSCVVDPYYWNFEEAYENNYSYGYFYKELRVCTYEGDVESQEYFETDSILWQDATDFWHCLICDSSGNIVAVMENGEAKEAEYVATMQEGYYAVWAWRNLDTDDQYYNGDAYNAISMITDANKGLYNVTYSGSTLTIQKGKTYHQADTKGFGMLYTKDMDIRDEINIWDNTSGAITGSIVTYNNSTYAEDSTTTETEEGFHYGFNKYTDDYGYVHYYPYQVVGLWDNAGKGYANQHLINGSMRTNLVQERLVDGKPIYSTPAVKWIAEYLQLALSAEWQNADGSYNTFYVTGDKVADGDTLANKIRAQIAQNNGDEQAKMGTYQASYDKFFKNGGLRTYEDINTWYDAAFFLMHNTWRDSSADDDGTDGYGKPIDKYDSLHLIAKTVDGKTTYVFNSMYNDTVYSPATGEIYNTQTEKYTQATTNAGDLAYADGNIQPVDRFDPLGMHGANQWLGYGEGTSGDTYGDMIEDSTANWADYYDETNYHLSLEGHAQFVYYEDDDLYFTFTGDDDVYLYINGIRVLDIGGGHSIAKVSINLNDIAALCDLKDGEAYPFDFFYMERHGTAANFGIETNIQLVESAMTTTKTGYQNGANTGYNGYVKPDTKVAYSFSLQNNGNAPIYNLSFNDPTIGVYFGYDDVTLYPEDETTHIYTIDELYLYRFNEDGSVKSSIQAGYVTEDKIMEELTAGLSVGETIAIYGFKYMIDKSEWVETDEGETFNNTVYTKASSTEKGAQDLEGKADWKVRKSTGNYTPFHVYAWMHKRVSNDPADTEANIWVLQNNGVTVTTKEILDKLDVLLKSDGKNVDLTGATVVPCGASGNTAEHNLNPNITLNKDENGKLLSLTYKSTIPGVDKMYFKIEGVDSIKSLVYDYYIYTYGVVDNVYVLDYGLEVELNGEDYGFQANDHLVVEQNKSNPSKSVFIKVTEEQKYGEFVFTHETDTDEEGIVTKDYGLVSEYASVKYVPDEIIDGADTFAAEIELRETPPAGVEITAENLKFYGVDMVENVTTVPASVVYYEENFPGITYVSEGENQWVHYETVDDEGESLAGTEQSADQESNYGSDPNYEEDLTGEWDGEIIGTTTLELSEDMSLSEIQDAAIADMNGYLGYEGQASNGTFNALEIKQTADVMFFDFVGTGFEIISRTTQEKYAVILVMVDRIDTTTDTDGNTVTTYTRVRQQPVICESKGGDLYQVPVISITDLERAQYRVTVRAAAAAGVDSRILYIDGVRIYGPLSSGDALKYYNPEEAHAEIYEIKSLICDHARVIYADIAEDGDGEFFLDTVTKTTLIEHTGDLEMLVEIADSPEEYMDLGPNNEIYFGGGLISVIAFYATPIEYLYVDAENPENNIPYPENARTIEIGAHRKGDSTLDSYGYAVLAYGSTPGMIYTEDVSTKETLRANEYAVLSGTEQYYTINVDKLEMQDGKYLVLIGTNGSEDSELLALTNLKVAGYTVSLTSVMSAPETATVDELSNDPMMTAMVGIYNLMKTTLEEEVDTTPVNENLFINSAAMRSTTVTYNRNAIMTVKATEEAQTVKIFAPDGTEVATSKCVRKVSGDTVTFQIQWKVTTARGNGQNFTIRVYDAAGNASVNTETVTVNIR